MHFRPSVSRVRRGPIKPAIGSGRRRAAFTMVEIALSLAVIAFALVAIIGVLPTGLRVQKDNREDTIINQDGMFLLEAIRSQSPHLDYLTNYFDSITVSNSEGSVLVLTNGIGGSLTNGQMIMDLLSLSKYVVRTNDGKVITNHVSANVRALSGSAVDKSKLTKDFAFAYRVQAEIIPLATHAPEFTNYLAAGLSAEEMISRSNLWRVARNQGDNFNELRLTLQGPIIQRGQKIELSGTPRTFRTVFGGYRFTNNVISQNTYSQRP